MTYYTITTTLNIELPLLLRITNTRFVTVVLLIIRRNETITLVLIRPPTRQ